MIFTGGGDNIFWANAVRYVGLTDAEEVGVKRRGHGGSRAAASCKWLKQGVI